MAYLGDPRLSGLARNLIEDPSHSKLISPASYWELAIKISIGKYQMAETTNNSPKVWSHEEYHDFR